MTMNIDPIYSSSVVNIKISIPILFSVLLQNEKSIPRTKPQ